MIITSKKTFDISDLSLKEVEAICLGLDADFKPMLTQDTSTGYDGGKIEGDMPQ